MSEAFPVDSHGKIIVFGAKQIRRIWLDGEWFFSVVDIIGALTDSGAPSKYWTAMKRREAQNTGFQFSTICRQLKLSSADGKSYKTDTVKKLITAKFHGTTKSFLCVLGASVVPSSSTRPRHQHRAQKCGGAGRSAIF